MASRAVDVNMIGRELDGNALSADLLNNKEYFKLKHLLQVLHRMNEAQVKVRGTDHHAVKPQAILNNIDQRLKLLEMKYFTTIHP